MTKFEYVLTGSTSGHPVRTEGSGVVRPDAVAFTPTSTEPVLAFDATFAHLVGIDFLAALSRGLVVGHDEPVVARCRADALTEGGAEVGTIVGTVAAHRRGSGYRCECQLTDARLAVEPGEGLATLGERNLRIEPTRGGVAIMSATTVTTSRGHEWTVLSTVVAVGCEHDGQSALTLSAIRRITAVGDR